MQNRSIRLSNTATPAAASRNQQPARLFPPSTKSGTQASISSTKGMRSIMGSAASQRRANNNSIHKNPSPTSSHLTTRNSKGSLFLTGATSASTQRSMGRYNTNMSKRSAGLGIKKGNSIAMDQSLNLNSSLGGPIATYEDTTIQSIQASSIMQGNSLDRSSANLKKRKIQSAKRQTNRSIVSNQGKGLTGVTHRSHIQTAGKSRTGQVNQSLTIDEPASLTVKTQSNHQTYRKAHSRIQSAYQNVTNILSPQSQLNATYDGLKTLLAPDAQNYHHVKKISISNLTYQENSFMKSQLQKAQDTADLQGPDQELLKTNCHDLLKQTDRDIKVINYKLSTVISSGEYHRVLQSDQRDIDIEVVAMTPIYCKVKSKGKSPPLIMKFKYKSIGDVKVYVDSYEKEPGDQKGAQKSVWNPKKLFFAPEAKEKEIQAEYIYIAFVSSSGCSIEVNVSFAESQEERRQRLIHEAKQFQKQQQQEYNIEEAEAEIERKHQAYLEEQKLRMNFLSRNIEQTQQWNNLMEEHNIQRKTLSQERAKSAKRQSKRLENQKRSFHSHWLVKWDQVRAKRAQDLAKSEELQRKQKFNRKWTIILTQYQIIKIISERFNKRKEEEIKRCREIYCVHRIMRMYHKSMLRYGSTINDRFRKELKRAITLQSIFTKEVSEKRAMRPIRAFLHQAAENNSTKNCFIQFHNTIERIQITWRRQLATQKGRIDTLHMLWERETANMIKGCMSKKNKNNKKSKALLKKINNLSQKIRDKVIIKYFERQKILNALKFHEWREQMKEMGLASSPTKREYQSPDQILEEEKVQRKQSMLKRQQTLKKVDKKLFSGFEEDLEEDSPTRGSNKRLGSGKDHSGSSHNLKGTKHQSVPRTTLQLLNTNQPPKFDFVPSDEVLRKLIKKACSIKKVEDLD